MRHPAQHSSSMGIQRQQLEAGIICLSQVRLAAALGAISGGFWHSACFTLVHLLALLLEFGRPAPRSPYQLRKCESHGISQGVLAVPSVLAALAVVAPQGAWQVWLQGSLAAVVATLATIYAQSAAIKAAKKAPAAVSPWQAATQAAVVSRHSSPRHTQNGCADEAVHNKQGSCQLHQVNGAATHQEHKHGQSGAAQHQISFYCKNLIGSSTAMSVAAAVAVLVGVALAAGWWQWAFSISSTQATGQVTSSGRPQQLAVLLGALLAPLCYCLIMQLLPKCFSIGEGTLLAQGAAALMVAAATALPSAAAFVPVVVCQQLPSMLLEPVTAAGGCTPAAHSWALSLQGLPSAVVLIMASVLVVCLALRLLMAVSTHRLHQEHSSRTRQHRKSSNSKSSDRSTSWALQLCSRLCSGLLCIIISVVLLWLAAAAFWTLLEVLPARPWRSLVLVYWAALLLVTLPALKLWAAHSTVPQIIVRKVYHLLAGALFVPVFFWDLQLLCLSLAISFAALVLLEVLRHLQLPWVGQAVQQFMQDFVDERDSGVIYVTHFTLLLGLAVPMWLCLGLPGVQSFAAATQQQQQLVQSRQHWQQSMDGVGVWPLQAPQSLCSYNCRLLLVMAGLSGLVIIGVGDTAASAVGKLLGRVPIHKGSKKTVEGTVAGVASSLGAWCLVLWCSGLGGGGLAWWVQLVLATAGAGLMEACTSQLDNILLPLWYLPHLILVRH